MLTSLINSLRNLKRQIFQSLTCRSDDECNTLRPYLFRLFNSLKLGKADELCPESYRAHSPDEIRLLAVADNFQRQYSHLYPDRKPLLLCPINECGVKVTLTACLLHHFSSFYFFLSQEGKFHPVYVSLSNTCVYFSNIQKFVSTTLRPTPTAYPEFFTWEGCASFVANFLSLDPLEPPVDLVRKATLAQG